MNSSYLMNSIIWFLISLAIALLCLSICLHPVHAGDCYRPPITYYPPPPVYYTPPVPYYIQKEYVPYVLEVQVYKDRYYSLSDLYRDRLYLEMFDTMKSYKQNVSSNTPTGNGGTNVSETIPKPPQQTTRVPDRQGSNPQVRQPQATTGKTSPEALAILNASCVSCHNTGNDALDLSNPDAVSLTKRRASLGLIAVRDMPKPPGKLKDKELEEWKKEHGLKEEEIQVLYEGWVNAVSKN